jgi:hypothetical protein
MAGPSFARRLFSRERLKTCGVTSNLETLAGVSPANGDWRDRMRALSYIIAFAFVLGGPSLAGSADRDMPGVGTFTYCGSPIVTPAPDVVASIGH